MLTSKARSAFNVQFPFFLFLGLYFCWSGSSSSPSFTHAFIHTNFTSYTTSSPLSFHMTHSHFIISTSNCLEAISTAFANFLFLWHLLNSNERLMVHGIISTVCLRSSHTNSNCSQTHRSTGHYTCVLSIANLVLKPDHQVCRDPQFKFSAT